MFAQRFWARGVWSTSYTIGGGVREFSWLQSSSTQAHVQGLLHWGKYNQWFMRVWYSMLHIICMFSLKLCDFVYVHGVPPSPLRQDKLSDSGLDDVPKSSILFYPRMLHILHATILYFVISNMILDWSKFVMLWSFVFCKLEQYNRIMFTLHVMVFCIMLHYGVSLLWSLQ